MIKLLEKNQQISDTIFRRLVAQMGGIMIEDLIRPEIRSFIPYDANQQPYKIKLDANESPFDMPLKARQRLAEFILKNPELNLYPDTDSIKLRKALSEHWDVDYRNIIVGTGSDQLIQMLANVFVGPGDKVLCPAPSFGMYADSCIIAGGTPVRYILEPENRFEYSKQAIMEAYDREKPKLIYICNPNNPTGNLMPKEDVLEVVSYCKNSVVIVDEAYAEFCGCTVIPDTKKYENLIVLRTFSKAYGLAGIRCGYSIAGTSLTRAVNLVRPPYNISSLSQYTALLVLEEKDEIQKNILSLVEERKRLSEELVKLQGIEVFESHSNFVLVRVENCREVYNKLCEKGIFLRIFGSSPLLKDCMRISVGTPQQNTILLEELAAICYN